MKWFLIYFALTLAIGLFMFGCSKPEPRRLLDHITIVPEDAWKYAGKGHET